MTEDGAIPNPLTHQQLKEVIRAVRETIRAEMRAERQWRQEQAQQADRDQRVDTAIWGGPAIPPHNKD